MTDRKVPRNHEELKAMFPEMDVYRDCLALIIAVAEEDYEGALAIANANTNSNDPEMDTLGFISLIWGLVQTQIAMARSALAALQKRDIVGVSNADVSDFLRDVLADNQNHPS